MYIPSSFSAAVQPSLPGCRFPAHAA
jgi:hypothetical protein